MLQEKRYIKRSAIDRRSFLNRRILNLGPVNPCEDQRIKKYRRKGWEDRLGWHRSSRWSSIPNALNFTSSDQSLENFP